MELLKIERKNGRVFPDYHPDYGNVFDWILKVSHMVRELKWEEYESERHRAQERQTALSRTDV